MMIASSTATTTYKPIRQPSSPTSQKVRSRFLYKIGIVDNSTPSSSTAISKNNSFNHLTSVVETLPTRDLQNVPRFSEPLKYNRCDERMREERHCAQIISYEENKMDVSGDEEGVPPATLSSKKKKQISFGEVVNVVPIPMRNEYSDRIRSRLWNNCAEIYENAGRLIILMHECMTSFALRLPSLTYQSYCVGVSSSSLHHSKKHCRVCI